MPLSFRSMSHGSIAFGFFNIESDMLLMENRFFFAPEFCRGMLALARDRKDRYPRVDWPSYTIDAVEDIGDLMGAIHGIRFTGFIGETYQHFPFPKDPAAFKQNPLGDQTRELFERLILKRAREDRFEVNCRADGTVCLGPYAFEREDFFELIRYVWMGGYPRWKDGIRPELVMEMRNGLVDSGHPLFNGCFHQETGPQ